MICSRTWRRRPRRKLHASTLPSRARHCRAPKERGLANDILVQKWASIHNRLPIRAEWPREQRVLGDGVGQRDRHGSRRDDCAHAGRPGADRHGGQSVAQGPAAMMPALLGASSARSDAMEAEDPCGRLNSWDKVLRGCAHSTSDQASGKEALAARAGAVTVDRSGAAQAFIPAARGELAAGQRDAASRAVAWNTAATRPTCSARPKRVWSGRSGGRTHASGHLAALST